MKYITQEECDRVVDEFTGMTYGDYLDNMMVEYEVIHRCEVCGKVGTQADTYMNMWLCDKHYSMADPYRLTKKQHDQLEDKFYIKATFKRSKA